MISIAIDGPAGAGKSTIAKALAKTLGYIYVDTGALYRAVGYYALQKGVDTTSVQQIEKILPEINVELEYVNQMQRVLLNNEDISDRIRTQEISMAASNVSALKPVRDFLFDLQQNMAKQHNVVMDGRDIGTVVLPHAQIKIFLTATPEERAKRRQEELCLRGIDTDYNTILEEVKQRDYNDSHRAVAPLKKATDAVEFNTTGNSLEKSITLLTNYVKDRLKNVL